MLKSYVFPCARTSGRPVGKPGGSSVTFVQRFGSALNVNLHFHVLMPDGIFVEGLDGDPVFVAAHPLTDDDV